jgi:CheY-like chemotaxis protein
MKQFTANASVFSAILTDHDMPNMNGHALVRYVRALGFKGLIVVVSYRLNAENLLIYQTHSTAAL